MQAGYFRKFLRNHHHHPLLGRAQLTRCRWHQDANMEKLVAMRDVKKGTRYRHWLFNQLKALGSGTPLASEECEYSRIGKFHRGIFWNAHRTFTTKEESQFIHDIAKEYGAFDY